MTLSQIMVRDTVLIPSGPAQDGSQKHLHVVMCNPTLAGMVLLVSITSCKNTYDDTTCILQAGDHLFITKESYVFYRFAQTRLVQHLLDEIKNKNCSLKLPIDEEIFNKIRQGFYRSRFTKKFVFEYLPE